MESATGVPGAAPSPKGITGVIGAGSAIAAGVIVAISRGSPTAVKDQITPTIADKTSNWNLFDDSKRRASLVQIVLPAVPMRWSFASSLRPSQMPRSHCDSAFRWRAAPVSRLWSGLGSLKSTVSLNGTTGKR